MYGSKRTRILYIRGGERSINARDMVDSAEWQRIVANYVSFFQKSVLWEVERIAKITSAGSLSRTLEFPGVV